MTTPAPVIACRDCRHWRPLVFQAWKDIERGECKAIPGNYVTDGADFCALWTAKNPPKADVPGPCGCNDAMRFLPDCPQHGAKVKE